MILTILHSYSVSLVFLTLLVRNSLFSPYDWLECDQNHIKINFMRFVHAFCFIPSVYLFISTRIISLVNWNYNLTEMMLKGKHFLFKESLGKISL